MNAYETLKTVAPKSGLPMAKVKVVLDALGAVLADSANAGKDVTIAGLGKFKSRVRPERQGASPQTGAVVTYPATRTIKFTLSSIIKNTLEV